MSSINKKEPVAKPAAVLDRLSSQQTLQAGAQKLGVSLDDHQVTQLLDYMALLIKWNAVYNLTAIRDPAQMVPNHLLDCLAVVSAFTGARRVLDVGAGAGLPGIVIAIWAQVAQPAMQITLVDTVHKKTAFLMQVKAALRLENVSVVTARVEQLPSAMPFDIITSRAFAELKDFVAWSGHLLAEGGQFIAMKGVVPEEEIARLPASWTVTKIVPLEVPHLSAKRHLIHVAGQSDLGTSAVPTKDNPSQPANKALAGLQYGPEHATCMPSRIT